MTLIAGFLMNNIPVLLGDMLISGPERTDGDIAFLRSVRPRWFFRLAPATALYVGDSLECQTCLTCVIQSRQPLESIKHEGVKGDGLTLNIAIATRTR